MDLHTTNGFEYENPVAIGEEESRPPAIQVEKEISVTHSIEVDSEVKQVDSQVNETADERV